MEIGSVPRGSKSQSSCLSADLLKFIEQVAFDSVDIQIRLVEPLSRSKEYLVITFQCKNARQSLGLPGFGQKLFAKHQVPALHVTVSSNHWYQTPDMRAALRTAAEVAAAYRRVVTYGSSMGGLGALTFSAAVDADAVIALSPLYSIDVRQVPFDNRYVGDMAGRDFLFDMASGSRRQAQAYLFYDPFSQDARHAGLIASCFDAAHLIPVPYGGHPCGRLLAEAGLLSATVLGLVRGDPFDARALRTALRCKRTLSSSYWNGMAKALMLRPHRNPETAVTAARRAVDLAPQDGTKLLSYGLALSRASRHVQAIEVAKDVVSRIPEKAAAHSALAMVYHRASNFDLALDAINQAIVLAPNWEPYRKLRSILTAKIGKRAQTLIDPRRTKPMRPEPARFRVSDTNLDGRIEQLGTDVETLEIADVKQATKEELAFVGPPDPIKHQVARPPLLVDGPNRRIIVPRSRRAAFSSILRRLFRYLINSE